MFSLEKGKKVSGFFFGGVAGLGAGFGTRIRFHHHSSAKVGVGGSNLYFCKVISRNVWEVTLPAGGWGKGGALPVGARVSGKRCEK